MCVSEAVEIARVAKRQIVLYTDSDWLLRHRVYTLCIFCCSTLNKRIYVQGFCPLTIGALTLVLCVSVNIHFQDLISFHFDRFSHADHTM